MGIQGMLVLSLKNVSMGLCASIAKINVVLFVVGLFGCIALMGNWALFAQPPDRDLPLKNPALLENDLPEGFLEEKGRIALVERLRTLRRNEARFGPKHPSMAGIRKQITDAEVQLRNMIDDYLGIGKSNAPQMPSESSPSLPQPSATGFTERMLLGRKPYSHPGELYPLMQFDGITAAGAFPALGLMWGLELSSDQTRTLVWQWFDDSGASKRVLYRELQGHWLALHFPPSFENDGRFWGVKLESKEGASKEIVMMLLEADLQPPFRSLSGPSLELARGKIDSEVPIRVLSLNNYGLYIAVGGKIDWSLERNIQVSFQDSLEAWSIHGRQTGSSSEEEKRKEELKDLSGFETQVSWLSSVSESLVAKANEIPSEILCSIDSLGNPIWIHVGRTIFKENQHAGERKPTEPLQDPQWLSAGESGTWAQLGTVSNQPRMNWNPILVDSYRTTAENFQKFDWDWFERSLVSENLQPWYLAAVRPNGFFCTQLDAMWNAKENPTATLVSQSRMIYSMAVGYEVTEDPKYLVAVQAGCAFLLERFSDRLHGGFFYELDANGKVLDRKKDGYGHAFAIYALSKAALVAREPSYSKEALKCWALLRNRMFEKEGGLMWTASEQFTGLSRRSQNPSMHLFEGLLELYEATHDPGVYEDAIRILDFVLNELRRPAGMIPEDYQDGWGNPNQNTDGTVYVILGHQVEWAFLISHAVELGFPGRYLAIGNQLLDGAIRAGYDPIDGGLKEPDGTKGAWQQAEFLRALIRYSSMHGRVDLMDSLSKTQYLIQRDFIDPLYGGWISPASKEKGNHWKAASHEFAMYLEGIRIARQIKKLHFND